MGDLAALISMLTTQTLFALGLLQIKGQEERGPDLELARYNIRVNVINPGVIDTPINYDNPEKMNQVLVQTTPMRRMGEPSEIAEAVLFVASDASSFATGADFTIDGGMSI